MVPKDGLYRLLNLSTILGVLFIPHRVSLTNKEEVYFDRPPSAFECMGEVPPSKLPMDVLPGLAF